MSSIAETPQNVPTSPAGKTNANDLNDFWTPYGSACYTPIGFITQKSTPTARLNSSKKEELCNLKELLLSDDWSKKEDKNEIIKSNYSREETQLSSLKIEQESDTIEVILDKDQFILPRELKHVADEIEQAKSILDLEENWNDEGAVAIPNKIFLRSVKLLVSYSKWLHDKLNIVIEAPIISPLPDGSLDLKWKTNNARLLLNVKNNDKMEAHYYGDFFNDENSFKGKINTNGVQEFFAYWMACLRS